MNVCVVKKPVDGKFALGLNFLALHPPPSPTGPPRTTTPVWFILYTELLCPAPPSHPTPPKKNPPRNCGTGIPVPHPGVKLFPSKQTPSAKMLQHGRDTVNDNIVNHERENQLDKFCWEASSSAAQCCNSPAIRLNGASEKKSPRYLKFTVRFPLPWPWLPYSTHMSNAVFAKLHCTRRIDFHGVTDFDKLYLGDLLFKLLCRTPGVVACLFMLRRCDHTILQP